MSSSFDTGRQILTLCVKFDSNYHFFGLRVTCLQLYDFSLIFEAFLVYFDVKIWICTMILQGINGKFLSQSNFAPLNCHEHSV